MNLTKTRNTTKYLAIKELSDENKTYSISALCEFAGIARSAYYKWLGHVNSDNDNLNERIVDTITKIHDEHPDMGYRRIRDTLAHDYKIAVNDKRVLRICRKKKIQSYIKHRYNCCTKPASDPAYVAENILNREFKSDMINQKWVTDVSEFKYGVGEDDKKGKLYLSVILDLCDRRPVAFVYSTRNDNRLVFDTFDKAVAANPGATPLLHSDRGYQYTSKAFRRRILAAGMTQSMSRVARCIDNGPMEGFWGLMKREMYYGKKYKTKGELILEKGVKKGSDKYKKRYAFSGKIICEECGNTFKRRIHTCTNYKYVAWACNTHLKDKYTCHMKYIRDDDIKAAFVTMLNKLIYGHRLILAPYLKALENSSGDEALQRIQHLELLLDQNSEQRETLTKLMAQGYIDQILYNQETNALLLQAETYRSDIEAITICMTGDSAKVTETNLLLHFVSHADMLTNYSEELFESYADHIEITGRNEIRFVMKCGLTFTERIGD